MDDFIFVVNRHRLHIYELVDETKAKILKIRGNKYYELDLDDIGYSIDKLKKYILDALNYNDFNNCNFNIIYNNIKGNIIGELFKQFDSCSNWGVQELDSILPTVLLKMDLLKKGDTKVVGFNGDSWEVNSNEKGIIKTENTDKNCEIELKIKDILRFFYNDYSFAIDDTVEINGYVENYNHKFTFDDEIVKGKYTGYIKNGKPHGFGKHIDEEKDIFYGEWENGELNGVVIVYSDEGKIIGEYENKNMDGLLMRINFDGSKFVSEAKENQPKGLFMQINKSGDKKVSKIEDDNNNGIGMEIHSDGTKIVYESIEYDKLNGMVMEEYENETKIVYEAEKGDHNGILMRKNEDGSKEVYEGINNEVTGMVMQSFEDGGKYIGENFNQKFYSGMILYNNGGKYIGGLKNQKLHSQGLLVFTDDYRYIGDFKNDEQHGQGVVYDDKDELIYAGKFKYGDPVDTESEGCFITTATCNFLDKGDNCKVLNTFRWFRDNWLVNQPKGKELIKEYYKIAPEIVNKINKKENKNIIYKQIWVCYLKPCLFLINNNYYEEAKLKYMDMVNRLKQIIKV